MPSLYNHNTFGIHASCREFKEYSTIDELRSLLPLSVSEKWLHIGEGSNLLFVDDYEGMVLHSLIHTIEETGRTDTDALLRVGSGVRWDDFVEWAISNGYYGLENLSYIPGEVGASAVQNIGAYGKEVADFIVLVEAIDALTGESRIFLRDDCCYAYRHSIFKAEMKGRYIVTHVTYRLSLSFVPDLQYAALRRALEERNIRESELTAQSLRQLIIDVRRSKLPEPSEIGSAGSFFMNPVVDEETAQQLLKDYPSMPHYVVDNGVKIPAGWMIEQCGWKGRSLGHAGVYSKQALVLVNLGGATGREIVHLSDTIQRDVKEKFGIDIYPEVNFIV